MTTINNPVSLHKIFNDIKAVIFDMDGVLVYNTEFHKKALREFCISKGFHLSDHDMIEKIYGRTNREWLLNLFDNKLSDELIEKYAQEKELLYREMYTEHIEAAPGLISFLNTLDHLNIPIAIGTSAPPVNVDFTLDRTNIRKYFQLIIDDTMITNSKPHPEIYLKAAHLLGLKPSECIIFEDSKSGILAAQASGAKVIAISSTLSQEELISLNTDLIIDDFCTLTSC